MFSEFNASSPDLPPDESAVGDMSAAVVFFATDMAPELTTSFAERNEAQLEGQPVPELIEPIPESSDLSLSAVATKEASSETDLGQGFTAPRLHPDIVAPPQPIEADNLKASAEVKEPEATRPPETTRVLLMLRAIEAVNQEPTEEQPTQSLPTPAPAPVDVRQSKDSRELGESPQLPAQSPRPVGPSVRVPISEERAPASQTGDSMGGGIDRPPDELHSEEEPSEEEPIHSHEHDLNIESNTLTTDTAPGEPINPTVKDDDSNDNPAKTAVFGLRPDEPGEQEGAENEPSAERQSVFRAPPRRLGLYTSEELIAVTGMSAKTISNSANAGELLDIRLDVYSNHRLFDPYIAALLDFRQAHNVPFFRTAADQFASAGQNLAWGIRAEHIDKINAFGEAQGGFLTISQAVTLSGVNKGWLRHLGLYEPVELWPEDHSLTIRADVLVERLRWTHQAFGENRIIPEPVKFCSLETARDMLQSENTIIIDIAADELIPTWRFNSDSTKIHYPQSYMEQLAQYHKLHPGISLSKNAFTFARLNPNAHSELRGQFESSMEHQAQQNDGYLPNSLASELLNLHFRSLRRIYGRQTDERGRTPSQLKKIIKWSYPRLTDYEKFDVAPKT
jgi:hypothetical protein